MQQDFFGQHLKKKKIQPPNLKMIAEYHKLSVKKN